MPVQQVSIQQMPIQRMDSDSEESSEAGGGEDFMGLFDDLDGEEIPQAEEPARLSRRIPPLSGTRLLSKRKFRRAVRKAWLRSMKRGHEHGGIVYQNEMTGKLHIADRTSRHPYKTNLTKPQHVPGFKPIANFHTHPNKGPHDHPGPSHADLQNAAERGVPGFAFTFPNAEQHRTFSGRGIERPDEATQDGSMFKYGPWSRDPNNPSRGYPNVRSEAERTTLHNFKLPGKKPVPMEVRPQKEKPERPFMMVKGRKVFAARKVGGRRLVERRRKK